MTSQTDVSRDLALKFGEQGVRYNFILGAGKFTSPRRPWGYPAIDVCPAATIGADTKAYDSAKEHMHALMRTEK